LVTKARFSHLPHAHAAQRTGKDGLSPSQAPVAGKQTDRRPAPLAAAAAADVPSGSEKHRNINNQAAGAHRRLRSVIGETRIDVPFSPTSLKSKPSQLLDFCFFAACYKLKPNNSFSPFHP
jgi:hypothetical protein